MGPNSPDLSLKHARLKRDEAAHLVALGEPPVQKQQQAKIVYQSTQATMLFREIKTMASTSDSVLAGRSTLTKPFTLHDLRRTASTLLHTQGCRRMWWIKHSTTPSAACAALQRVGYAAQRKEILQAWADFIDGLAPASNLVVDPGEV